MTKLVGLMPVRNEAWCLRATLRAALEWCEEVVVFLHACTDESGEIVAELQGEYPARIKARSHNIPDWEEMNHRQTMLEIGRGAGGTHFALLDADELLTAPLAVALGNYTRTLKPGYILQIPGYNLRGGLDRYHLNGVWGNRWFSVAFADRPDLHWSGNRYHHREPMSGLPGSPLTVMKRGIQGYEGVMHLWGSSERRLCAKHALYKLTDPQREEKGMAAIDALYSLAVHGDRNMPAALWTFKDVPGSWWRDEYRNMIELGREPWQVAECERLLAERPELRVGLDLFGIV